MTKEQDKMLKKAIADVEDAIESWQKVINGAEEAKLRTMEELKELSRQVKKLK